ncbi:MAG: HNH endonuclease [Fibrobacteres bacterium]|nr:HNH endonuclease [Fibrobacterota bacterium]
MNKCQLCAREAPDEYLEKHHLTPKSKGGTETIVCCIDCGNQVHKLFTIKELEHTYNTLNSLLLNEKVIKWVSWVRKKNDFGVCMKTKK